ncbi:MAG: hypothetical protein AAB458_02050 [Patescibacteria group bacterium]
MAEQFQTSFIPKKSFDVGPVKPARVTSLFFIISMLLFILSVAAAAGVFGYQKFLESSIVRKKEELQKARAAFEPELIRELSRLDTKLRTAEELLSTHIAVTGIFELLQGVTLETVQFTDFGYALEPLGVRITMSGLARSFASVALQSDEFGKNRFIREPVFSGFSLDDRGDVEFSVTALIDPSVVSYEGRLKDAGTAVITIPSEVAGAENEEEPVEKVPETL